MFISNKTVQQFITELDAQNHRNMTIPLKLIG